MALTITLHGDESAVEVLALARALEAYSNVAAGNLVTATPLGQTNARTKPEAVQAPLPFDAPAVAPVAPVAIPTETDRQEAAAAQDAEPASEPTPSEAPRRRGRPRKEAPVVDVTPEPPASPVNEQAAPAPDVPAPADVVAPAEAQAPVAPAPQEQGPEITREALQEALGHLLQKKGMPACQELLGEFGTTRLSELVLKPHGDKARFISEATKRADFNA